MLKYILAFTLLMTTPLLPTHSGDFDHAVSEKSVFVKPTQVSLDKTEATKMAEAWFNTLSTLKSDFSQVVNGRTQIGQFYYQRPGKFLWQYAEPTPQKIVSTGAYVFYHDEQSDQVTQVPRSMPLVQLLTAKTVSLNNKSFKPLSASQTDKKFSVNVALMADDIEDGRFTLVFNKSPRQLEQITVTDVLGNQTIIKLSNVRTGVTLAKRLFRFTPPHYEEN